MKIYENSEIRGSLKIRGRVRDRVTTDGGFYSHQFGAVIYKGDVPSVSASSNEFYGITVKNQNLTLTPNAAFSKINTITFRAPDFYLSQNFPNTDEVTVALREDRVPVIGQLDPLFLPKGTLNARTIYSMDMPANMLPAGRVLYFRFIMAKIQGGNRTSEFNIYIDDVRIFGHDGVGGGTTQINIYHPMILQVWLGVASNPEHPNKIHVFVDFQQPALSATVVPVGYGRVETFNAAGGQAFNHFITFDPTIAHTITFTEVPSATDVAWLMQNTLVRLM